MTERPTAELWALLDAPQASTADNALEALAERGAATKWRSAELQPRYAVSTTQLETTTRCRGDIADAVGVLGEQSVEKLAVLFAGVMLSAMLSPSRRTSPSLFCRRSGVLLWCSCYASRRTAT